MNSVLSPRNFILLRGTTFLVFHGFRRGIATALLYYLPLILDPFFFFFFFLIY